MAVVRCPTCLGILVEPEAERCPTCKQRLNRRRPVSLTTRGQAVDPADHLPKVHGMRRKGRHFGARGDVK